TAPVSPTPHHRYRSLEFKDALAVPILASTSTLSRLGWLILDTSSTVRRQSISQFARHLRHGDGGQGQTLEPKCLYPHHQMGTLLMARRFWFTKAPRKEPRLKRMANLPNTLKRMNYERCTDERRDSTHLSCPRLPSSRLTADPLRSPDKIGYNTHA
ncbi:hypothetical protein H4582DRAFT_2001584, partial [Lactarius indigo]